MKKKKILKRFLIIFGIIVLAVLIYFSINLIKSIVITNDSGETLSNSLEGTEELEENAENYKLVESKDGYTVPVPTGYTASNVESEMYVEDGFVIYEGTTAVTDTNVEEERTTRNQWVWVPVDDIDRIYSESIPGTKTGKYYTFSTTGRTEAGTDREPAVLSAYDSTYYFTIYGLLGMTKESFYQELQAEFESTIKSIKKYGGFYIGRYETGDLSSSVPVVKKMNEDISNIEWYPLYSKMGYLAANTYVKTNMIWGCLWDETLQWLVDSGSLDQEDLVDSTSWGNYRDSSVTYKTTSGTTTTTSSGSGTVIPAGSSEDTNVNNIYDMAGNVIEWTLEASATYYRYARGGYYSNSGASYPASYRYSSISYGPTYSYDYLGCRAYLYIQ